MKEDPMVVMVVFLIIALALLTIVVLFVLKHNDKLILEKQHLATYNAMMAQQTIMQFCERVNDLACQNMLQPPYKLEGQHKRAMVILAREAGIHLSFSDEKVGLN